MGMDDNNAPAVVEQRPLQITPLELFEVLLRENADSLTAFVRAAVNDAAAVDDLLQETMLIAWRKIGEYDRSRPFGAWLRGIARRLVLSHYRMARREIAFSDERILDYLDQRLAQIDARPGDTFDDKIAALHECMERLQPHYLEPIKLHYNERRTTEWIARQLEVTKDAIQKRLQRARAQLAECLEHKGMLTKMG